jgi:hypothetical protein
MKVHIAHCAWLSLLAVAASGCGNKMLPVKGRVHFADGTPLTQGKVIVNAVDGLHGASSGPLDEDGNFTLGSFGPSDGVPPGRYSVSIVGAVIPPASEEERAKPPRYLIDPRFLNPATSNLTLEVTPDAENFLDITVTKPGKK